ncbi:hypothetical protein FYK55_15745 [Roseiconus nitratireducens]|uniref:Transmembrane protein n=1 Tax=Roseiconus nitratireducens TaxID=2605748 RepID=A0A5M6D4I5_9BACT|nr:hypothetical protein [Roseiconus nitratireducens]KAA5542253.1 hypothetical protein FYK55_15745 [Roseiconus nitratireducens]
MSVLATVDAAPCRAQSPAEASSTEPDRNKPASGDSTQPYSPLHDFLGIDPQTGKFNQPAAPRPNPPADDGSATTPSSTEDLPREAEAASEAFRRATERINEGSLEDIASMLNDSMQTHPLYRIHQQIVWVSVALMLLYPIGIVASELISFALARRQANLTETDRVFQRVRLRRRLTLAAVLSGVIVLFGFGSVHAYWWDRPLVAGIFAVTVMVLGTIAVLLANLIRDATRTHQLDLIREVRREQLEMRADLEDIRQQLQRGKS